MQPVRHEAGGRVEDGLVVALRLLPDVVTGVGAHGLASLGPDRPLELRRSVTAGALFGRARAGGRPPAGLPVDGLPHSRRDVIGCTLAAPA